MAIYNVNVGSEKDKTLVEYCGPASFGQDARPGMIYFINKEFFRDTSFVLRDALRFDVRHLTSLAFLIF